MNSPALHTAQRIENQLSKLYESLHEKERLIALAINRYTDKRDNRPSYSLSFSITLNLCTFAGLFYLLY